MGVRQSFGLIMQPLTRDIAITVADFTLAIALQNLAWGFLQPVVGALAVRLGFRVIMLAGAGLYVAGRLAHGARTVPPLSRRRRADRHRARMHRLGDRPGGRVARRREKPRSLVLGAVTAAGSLGALLAAPIGQMLASEFGWRAGVIGFLVLALGMLPAAWLAGRVDAVPLPRQEAATDISGRWRCGWPAPACRSW